jgi:hypothetical protein
VNSVASVDLACAPVNDVCSCSLAYFPVATCSESLPASNGTSGLQRHDAYDATTNPSIRRSRLSQCVCGGFPNPEAMLRKARIASEISATLKEAGLTLLECASFPTARGTIHGPSHRVVCRS